MPEPRGNRCIKCGRENPFWAVGSCVICGNAICHRCATPAYGRSFCSERCADFFFHGEGEDAEVEEG
ncbi:MAG: hypothetical protein V1750_04905 [Acidobacteriota bacterium]